MTSGGEEGAQKDLDGPVVVPDPLRGSPARVMYLLWLGGVICQIT